MIYITQNIIKLCGLFFQLYHFPANLEDFRAIFCKLNVIAPYLNISLIEIIQ